MKRTDCHAPSRLIPSDYVHVLTFSHAGVEDGFPVPAHNVDVLRAMQEAHPFFRQSITQCHVCGAVFRMGDVFEHTPTGEHVVVGWECANKIATLDRSAFDRALGEVRSLSLQEARKAQKAEQVAAFLAANEGLAEALKFDHPIVSDIGHRLQQLGELSEAQVALVHRIVRERTERNAERKVPVAFADGVRAEVEGVVESLKSVEGFRGRAETKVVVRVTVPDGGVFRLWGSLPRGLAGVQKGAVVRFAATVEHGRRDPAFGFFKRPAGAVLVSGVAPVAS